MVLQTILTLRRFAKLSYPKQHENFEWLAGEVLPRS